jgi:hypothetical protein
MMTYKHGAAIVKAIVCSNALFLCAASTADELVDRPRPVITVEVDKESLRIDVPTAIRAIEVSLSSALRRDPNADVKMAAIDTPPRG